MVHHLGMGLVATNNYLNGDPMVRRFEAEPEVRATLLLLQERIPREAPEIEPHPAPVDRDRNWHEELLPSCAITPPPTPTSPGDTSSPMGATPS